MSSFEPNAEDIQAVIISQDIIDGIAALSDHVNDDAIEVRIDPRALTCQKTGHVIGFRDENSLFSLMKIWGKEHFVGTIYHATSLNTHPSWIHTNGENLDILIEADPVGYACYCFNLITEQFYQSSRNLDRKRLPAIERHWALARANALLIARGIGELAELNGELCRFLTYAPDTKTYLFKQIKEFGKSADMLAVLAVSGELTGLLRTATEKALAGIGWASYAINGVDIVDHRNRLKKVGLIDEIYRTPADAARGPSNIRRQKSSTRDIKEATLFGELSKLFGGLERKGIRNEGDFAIKKWRDKIAGSAFEPFANDLEALGNFRLENIEAPGEAGENEVEVRKLAANHEFVNFASQFQKDLNALPVGNEQQSGSVALAPIPTIEIINESVNIPTQIYAEPAPKPLTLREKLAFLKGGN